ncbi:MAG TPA: nicotinate-nicotinamide nucleotide adenylyltransferase, partial [Phycisphaerales bacterium]|nr:nicotinate-nicotinamide nucleotide adenylyltransferase [Phycisphaerales bacterium]
PALVFVPAAISPFKRRARAGASGEDRVAMLRAAIKGVDRASVWTEEIDRAERARREIEKNGGGEVGGGNEPGPSYWIDTLCALRTQIDPPGRERVRVWFILGSDQVVQFHRWKSYREILTLAEPVVLLREPVGTKGELKQALAGAGVWSGEEVGWWLARVAEVGLEDVSSTHIRGLLARCSDAHQRGEVDHAAEEDLGRWLAPGVLEVIRERGLYGNALS